MYRLPIDSARLQYEPGGMVICFGVKGSRKAAEAIVDDVSTHPGKLFDCEVKQHRERRSLDANAYFHVLVGELADNLGLGFEEMKTRLVLEYGTPARDKDGFTVGFKLPVAVDVTSLYRYAKCFDTRTENGREFNCYIAFKHTSDLDTKEMSKLIDGTVQECKEQGLETATPAELARMKEEWR